MNILRDFQKTSTPGECSWMAEAARSPTWETSSVSCDLDMIKVPFDSQLKVVILSKRGSFLSDASKQNWHWLGLGHSGLKAMLWTSLSKMHFVWSTYHVSGKSRILLKIPTEAGSSVRCSPSVSLHGRATVRPWTKIHKCERGQWGPADLTAVSVCLLRGRRQSLGCRGKLAAPTHRLQRETNAACGSENEILVWGWGGGILVSRKNRSKQELVPSSTGTYIFETFPLESGAL